ncbi:protein SOGA3a isoform X2 [Genypterus blacodes]|uniref:protein SOGA3a isoform X2 n=1 Tax=Genypterus blacodes TaxID=154954 RepID=UPI003F759CA3
MWNAFMNGSGLHGAGGAGGGYVPSQGWEFVPCSRVERTDRGRGCKSRNPLRRISSPPTIFSQMCEPLFSAAPGGGEGLVGTPVEVFRDQMWPGSEPQQQQQTQHIRLKKKFEDLKKRHVQDKEEWMREKGLLLREVADIQGGENRRILLDLKSVLEEVQAEVKREEEKRSELHLQYTRDRCAWDLEKAELKCRIVQLEVRESGEVQPAACPSSASSRGAAERRGETSTLRREREEQRRLLADTHSTAMDLRCRLEHNERDWTREKAELLERFETERREWENQLKDMQRKIEVMYSEVRAKRGGTRQDGGRHGEEEEEDDDDMLRLSINSTSSDSSLLSDRSRSEPLSSSSQSDPNRHRPPAGFYRNREQISDGERSGGDQPNAGGRYTRDDRILPELADALRSRGLWQSDGKEAEDTAEQPKGFQGASGCGESQRNDDGEQNVRVSPVWTEPGYCSDKKKNNTALNAALKEIARVSEELCSYQDQIRKKAGDKSNRSESLCLAEEREIRLEVEEGPCDLNEIYDDFRALETENWVTPPPDDAWQANRRAGESCRSSSADSDGYRDRKTNCGLFPPVPPRTSSWNLSAPTNLDTELHIPDSPYVTGRRCHSPCVLADRKCGSPSIVRKFEAMLQENEGKVLIDGLAVSCSIPASSKCNTGCCHNRWSCDVSKFVSSKTSAHGAVQKSFSEVNILTAGKDLCSDYHTRSSEGHHGPLVVEDLRVDLLLPVLDVPPVSPNLQGSKRNIMLELKTAEFNRTLFQAEMGRGVEEPQSFVLTDASSVGLQPDEASPWDNGFHLRPQCAEVTGERPAVTSTSLNPGVQPGRSRSGHEGQVKQEVLTSDRSPERSEVRTSEGTAATSERLRDRSDVKHRVRPSECVFPASTHPAQTTEGPGSKSETPHGGTPHSARVGGSPQHPTGEKRARKTTQRGHQAQPGQVSHSDSSRPGPRMMSDHPWKPLTLAAYPRLEGSRSNYGAVERILKNYESAARAKQSQSSNPDISPGQKDNITDQNMLDMLDPLPSHTHSTHSVLRLPVQAREDYRWNT